MNSLRDASETHKVELRAHLAHQFDGFAEEQHAILGRYTDLVKL